MDENDLKDITKYLRSQCPAPTEVYAEVAKVLEALWEQNRELRERIEKIERNAHSSTWGG